MDIEREYVRAQASEPIHKQGFLNMLPLGPAAQYVARIIYTSLIQGQKRRHIEESGFRHDCPALKKTASQEEQFANITSASMCTVPSWAARKFRKSHTKSIVYVADDAFERPLEEFLSILLDHEAMGHAAHNYHSPARRREYIGGLFDSVNYTPEQLCLDADVRGARHELIAYNTQLDRMPRHMNAPFRVEVERRAAHFEVQLRHREETLEKIKEI